MIQTLNNNVGSSSMLKSMGTNGMAGGQDGAVAMAVPANLKTLIRMIMRAFYGFELYLIVEMLMQYPCIKEEDLADLLRLDLKAVHQQLVNLKKEKFINERSIMETTPDGRQSKHSYFYINYKMTVNVIKYKLDKIRIQIESEEKQCTSRANFKCTNCSKTYSDLDTKDIFLTMRCLYCNHDVEEDVSTMPNRSSRNLLAKFNTQMEIVFELLSRVEHVQLADDILRPEPIDISHVLEKLSGGSPVSPTNGSAKNGVQTNGKSAMVKFDSLGNMKWSGDKTRNVDLLGQTKISINFDSGGGNAGGIRKPRELPSIILLNQTNEEDFDMNRDSALLNSVKLAANETIIHHSVQTKTDHQIINNTNSDSLLNSTSTSFKPSTPSATSAPTTSANLDIIIMQKLLKHEKKIDSQSNLPGNNLNQNHVAKKRELNLTQEDEMFFGKKRKLNNGGTCIHLFVHKSFVFHLNLKNQIDF